MSRIDDKLLMFIADLKHNHLLTREVKTLSLSVYPQNATGLAILFTFFNSPLLNLIVLRRRGRIR
jgi:hypothetical protein